MSMYGQGPRRGSYRSARSGPSSAVTILLIVLGMVLLFGAGFALSSVLRGQSSGGGGAATSSPTGDSTASGSSSADPNPCVTVTIIPGEGLPWPREVNVNVYNSTTRTGLAAETADSLKGRGFVIVKIANDPLGKPIAGVAEIRYGARSQRAARLLSFYIKGAIMVNDNRKGTDVDLSLGEQFESILPQTEVDRDLMMPSPSPSGPGCSSGLGPAPSSEDPSDSGSESASVSSGDTSTEPAA